jgi:hypothetical protein
VFVDMKVVRELMVVSRTITGLRHPLDTSRSLNAIVLLSRIRAVRFAVRDRRTRHGQPATDRLTISSYPGPTGCTSPEMMKLTGRVGGIYSPRVPPARASTRSLNESAGRRRWLGSRTCTGAP